MQPRCTLILCGYMLAASFAYHLKIYITIFDANLLYALILNGLFIRCYRFYWKFAHLLFPSFSQEAPRITSAGLPETSTGREPSPHNFPSLLHILYNKIGFTLKYKTNGLMALGRIIMEYHFWYTPPTNDLNAIILLSLFNSHCDECILHLLVLSDIAFVHFLLLQYLYLLSTWFFPCFDSHSGNFYT